MAKCEGKGFEECAYCVNAECDPFECDDCEDGSNFEPADTSEELSVHDLKVFMMKEAA